MRRALERWIADADALMYLRELGTHQRNIETTEVANRIEDYYLSLVGQLFDGMRDGMQPAEWARLGNAFGALIEPAFVDQVTAAGINTDEAALFAGSAFYRGGFPASAFLTLRSHSFEDTNESSRACYELIARPTQQRSRVSQALRSAIRDGDKEALARIAQDVLATADKSLALGPQEWVANSLLALLVTRLLETNIRAVLPNGFTEFWTPFVQSMMDRRSPSWEFFPSQIAAISAGLLEQTQTFSLQMPTGAGKTALCETLLYHHLQSNPAHTAVLLVPLRSLAAELRDSVVYRLNKLSIPARCAYGGTIPSGEEVRELGNTRALVATPESLSALLSADPGFFQRLSLVICDEGHLLDGGNRGIGLELLLARLRSRRGGPPRFVFVSAIVPNIAEINAWLGGSAQSVVVSDYRPALAEFALIDEPSTPSSAAALVVHPQEDVPIRYRIDAFLEPADFRWTNPSSGRPNKYSFSSFKTQAIAAGRKALGMGAVAVFSANKGGAQGAIGLAEELLKQLAHGLSLPTPISFASNERVALVAEYLRIEFGQQWVGTKTLEAGAILHHGDIPQEAREVLESLLRTESVAFAICTSTLAEGVNLPIRTLVLYSIDRLTVDGRERLLIRDIKNLVGRAGRAGATTKGLVICVNPGQWPSVEKVAKLARGEVVAGALLEFVDRIRRLLATRSASLSNAIIESSPLFHSLVDGIDATLIDLAAMEIGDEELRRLAVDLAQQTFAYRQADELSRVLLRELFALRATRILEVRGAGRLSWIRETGARARMLESVESYLLPAMNWSALTEQDTDSIIQSLVTWSLTHRDLQNSLREAFRLEPSVPLDSTHKPFHDAVKAWISGISLEECARASSMDVDRALAVYARPVGFSLQTIVEQAVALLNRLIDAQGQLLSESVRLMPEFLRFGVPNKPALLLMNAGLKFRRAAVQLAAVAEINAAYVQDPASILSVARVILRANPTEWRQRLSTLVYDSTLTTLDSILSS